MTTKNEDKTTAATPNDNPMVETRLVAIDGGFVADVRVPPFIAPPAALIWGERVFLRDPYSKVVEGDTARPIYKESFTYTVPKGSEVKR